MYVDNGVFNLFSVPVKENIVNFAKEAKVSMISNPYEITDNLTSILLENYFSEPRFLRKNDIFGIDVKEHVLDQMYLHINYLIPIIYFKVNTIVIKDKTCTNGCYILHGETTLIQEPNVHSYLPGKCSYYDASKEKLIELYPSGVAASLEHLERCILPFIKYGNN